MVKIGDFSKLSRISIRMLRHYDDMGLLKPCTVDSFTGYRYYSPAQLQTANRIASLRDMGFSLASIMEIIRQYHDPLALEAFLSVRLAEVREQEREARDRLALIETAMKRLREDEYSMKYDVTLKTMPQRYVASLRKTIPAYNDEKILWDQMTEEMGGDLPLENPCYPMAVFHDESYKESDVDVEVQLAVKGKRKNTANVVFKTVGPIEMASAVCKGSYDKVAQVNEVVCAWVSYNVYEYNGPMFFIYHVSPAHEPNPEKWVTEICHPVRKK